MACVTGFSIFVPIDVIAARFHQVIQPTDIETTFADSCVFLKSR